MASPQPPPEAQSQVAYGIVRTPVGPDLVFEAPTWTGLLGWNDTKFIRFVWVDLSSVTRCKVLTLKHSRALVSKSPSCVSTMLATRRRLVDGSPDAGGCLFEVDLSPFRFLPYIPGHAMVFGRLKPINIGPGPQLADPFCPRTILKSAVECDLNTRVHYLNVDTSRGEALTHELTSPSDPSPNLPHSRTRKTFNIDSLIS